MRIFAYLFFLFISVSNIAQGSFTSSNLPIIIINTNGKPIQDEPKIDADMGIIYNGPNQINRITDPKNVYDGRIGIELRGSSSQSFPKKPYGIETQDSTGEDLDVPLLGMPKESDWTLNAAYNDKSLMRDGLAYILAGSVMEYAPRVRYCELILNSNYQGVYLLIEKIKRDKNRVDISKISKSDKSGDAVTGGYIIKLDKTSGSNSWTGWFSQYKPFENAIRQTYFQCEYPNTEDITPEQKSYIEGHMHLVESVIASDDYKDKTTGYRKYIDVNSLMDFIIFNELTKNPDGYRLSTFFYKEKDSDGGLIRFGPVWDFNLGFGNVNYCTQGDPEGLVLQNFNSVCSDHSSVIHFWWKKFLDDPEFYLDLKKRWLYLRKNQFSLDKILNKVDSISTLLGAAQNRNFARWPVLGQYVWPNYYIGKNYSDEVNWLKSWISSRINYLDYVWFINTSEVLQTQHDHVVIHPNPANDMISIKIPDHFTDHVHISLTDYLGRSIDIIVNHINEQVLQADIGHIAPGIYQLKILDDKRGLSSILVKI